MTTYFSGLGSAAFSTGGDGDSPSASRTALAGSKRKLARPSFHAPSPMQQPLTSDSWLYQPAFGEGGPTPTTRRVEPTERTAPLVAAAPLATPEETTPLPRRAMDDWAVRRAAIAGAENVTIRLFSPVKAPDLRPQELHQFPKFSSREELDLALDKVRFDIS